MTEDELTEWLDRLEVRERIQRALAQGGEAER